MTQEQTATNLPGGEYFYGTGRRKTAIARVRIYPGSGEMFINDKPYLGIFTRAPHQNKLRLPFETAGVTGTFDVYARVSGGGVTAWADAIAHGITRALVAADERYRSPLRKAGLLTRDPRIKERKKPGLKRARKAPQYTKR
jgi:small subunit ribosomal protein S9